MVDIESTDATVTSAPLQTSSGVEFGTPRGRARLVLAHVNDGITMIQVGSASLDLREHDRDAMWQVAAPLLESLHAP